jgi:hypothetical protein
VHILNNPEWKLCGKNPLDTRPFFIYFHPEKAMPYQSINDDFAENGDGDRNLNTEFCY